MTVGCFQNTSIKEVNLPLSARKIDICAFADIPSLKKVNLCNVCYLGSHCFQNTGIEEITIPHDVEEILEYTFADNPSLKTVTLLNHVTSLHSHCFQNTGIEEITIPASVNYISATAFYQCEKLQTIILRNKELLNKLALKECNNLKKAKLESSEEEYAFKSYTVTINKDQIKLKALNETALLYYIDKNHHDNFINNSYSIKEDEDINLENNSLVKNEAIEFSTQEIGKKTIHTPTPIKVKVQKKVNNDIQKLKIHKKEK